MARTIVSLPLDAQVARQAGEYARRQGKSRSEYLRDLVSGHLRAAAFQELHADVQKGRKSAWPQDEDEIVALVKAARRAPGRRRH